MRMKNRKYVIMHQWQNQDYENGGFEVYDDLFDTEEEAQEAIDYDMAATYNAFLEESILGLKISPDFNQLLAIDDFGDEMVYDSWSIKIVYGK
jgi:hypothetical protein